MNTQVINANSSNLSNSHITLPNITRQFSMLFSSDPVSGAINISNSTIDAGSRFTLNLPYPISIPVMAKSCELFATEFLGWWTMLNIFQGVNDTFVFSISGQTFTCVIPAGIYNLANLASAINRAYSNLTSPAPTLPFPINFLSDDSTQRVVFQ